MNNTTHLLSDKQDMVGSWWRPYFDLMMMMIKMMMAMIMMIKMVMIDYNSDCS